MKVIHMADLHYSPKHLKWVDKAVSHAVDHAMAIPDLSLVVIAGDSFDSSMGIHEPAYAAYIKQVTRLASNFPVVILQGTQSHDRIGSLEPLKHIHTAYPILVADEPGQWLLYRKYEDMGYEFINISDISDIELYADGRTHAVISAIPSLNKALPEVMEHGARQYVVDLCESFSKANAWAAENDISSILVSHGTVTGCKTESKFAMVSPDHEFDPDTLFSAGATATMLGHIHECQSWNDGGQAIAYSGSIARLVHGQHSPVGYLVWDINNGDASFQFHETPSRHLIEVEYDGEPDMEELAAMSVYAGEDDAVRIRWTIDQEHAHSVDQKAIRALFKHVDSLAIEPTVMPIESVRSPGISKGMSDDEKLGYWAITTGDEENLPELINRLTLLKGLEPDQIIQNILQH